MEERNLRKTRVGVVVSDKMDKTIVVAVKDSVQHPLYKKILKECIEGEDKKKPLTDDELADILKEKGYPIARRTVAKYRQQLNIPVARLRK